MNINEKFQRHPLLHDAVLWAIPALIVGAVLRGLLLSYQPYAYWGSDSSSYFSFVDKLLTDREFNLEEKRRYIYPLLLFPLTALPGALLKWLAWLQHAFGLLTLLPLAYVVRKSFAHWRWIILPVTILYASLPLAVWYEHELLGETIFYAGFIWAMAGWAAWYSQTNIPRARLLWWWFFAGYSVILLTKPSGRFIVPGVIIALIIVRAWRVLSWKQLAPLAIVVAISGTMGSDGQSSWLLYSSAFPLTRLDTPLHANYKAEIRKMVIRSRTRLGSYFLLDSGPKGFLKYPEKRPDLPLWAALGKEDETRAKIYRELAMEGIRSRPDLFLFIAAQRIVSSSRLLDFKMERFDGDYFSARFERHYEEMTQEHPEKLRRILALPKGSLPDYRQISPRLGKTGTDAEKWLKKYLHGIQEFLALVTSRGEDYRLDWAIVGFRPAACGWIFIAGMILSVSRFYRGILGVWVLIAVGYLFGVFLVGSANPRFFGAAWPPILLAIAIPFDVLLRVVIDRKNVSKMAGHASQAPGLSVGEASKSLPGNQIC